MGEREGERAEGEVDRRRKDREKHKKREREREREHPLNSALSAGSPDQIIGSLPHTPARHNTTSVDFNLIILTNIFTQYLLKLAHYI